MIIILAFVFASCNFGGELSSICNIDYTSSEIESNQIIDSLKVLNPSLGESNQDKFSYSTEEAGFEEDVIFLWFQGVHYVLSISYFSEGSLQRLKVTHFGIDGEILEKFDGLQTHQLEIAAQIIRSLLLTELEKNFPNIDFSCDCGTL